jgi:hypothetical protein
MAYATVPRNLSITPLSPLGIRQQVQHHPLLVWIAERLAVLICPTGIKHGIALRTHADLGGEFFQTYALGRCHAMKAIGEIIVTAVLKDHDRAQLVTLL